MGDSESPEKTECGRAPRCPLELRGTAGHTGPVTAEQKKSVKHHLKHSFGFSGFKPNQQDIIEASLAGRDLFAALPTVFGPGCLQPHCTSRLSLEHVTQEEAGGYAGPGCAGLVALEIAMHTYPVDADSRLNCEHL